MKQHGRIAAMIFTAVNVILMILCIIFFVRMDRVAPEFRFSMNDLIYEDGMEESRLLEGITAIDNRDKDVTDSIVIEKIIKKDGGNSVVVFYAVSDESDNVTKTSRMFPCMSKESENIEPTENAASVLSEASAGESENMQGSNANAAPEAEAETVPSDDTAAEEAGDEAAETEETETQESEAGDAEDSESEDAETENARDAEPEAENTEAEDRAERDNAETENRTAEQQSRTEAERTNTGAPVLTLKTNEVTVEAGTPPAWVSVIQSLSDDKDSYETLFHNLNVSEYDIHKAGTYQVTVTTTDSDKQVSQPVALTIHVK